MKNVILTVFLLLSLSLQAQKALVSGPMMGYIEHREALIWLEVAPDVNKVVIKYQQQNKPQTAQTIQYEGLLGKKYNPIKVRVEELDMNTAYEYAIFLNDKVTLSLSRLSIFFFPLISKSETVLPFRLISSSRLS